MLSGDQPSALPAGFSGFTETVLGEAVLVGFGSVSWASYPLGCTTEMSAYDLPVTPTWNFCAAVSWPKRGSKSRRWFISVEALCLFSGNAVQPVLKGLSPPLG